MGLDRRRKRVRGMRAERFEWLVCLRITCLSVQSSGRLGASRPCKQFLDGACQARHGGEPPRGSERPGHRVWGVGAHGATLSSHAGAVPRRHSVWPCSARGSALQLTPIGNSDNGATRLCCVGTWDKGVHTVPGGQRVTACDPRIRIRRVLCLTRCWRGPEALNLEHTLLQPSGVFALWAANGGEWAGVGRDVWQRLGACASRRHRKGFLHS